MLKVHPGPSRLTAVLISKKDPCMPSCVQRMIASCHICSLWDAVHQVVHVLRLHPWNHRHGQKHVAALAMQTTEKGVPSRSAMNNMLEADVHL